MKYYSIGQFAKLIGYCRVSSNKQKMIKELMEDDTSQES